MSEVVKCDICGKIDDGHALNGFSNLSFFVQEDGLSKRKNIDLCPKHSSEMTNLILDWVKKEKKNFV
jgi:hypothetical protein